MKKRAATSGVQLFSFLDAMIRTMAPCRAGACLCARPPTEAVHKAEAHAHSGGKCFGRARDVEWRTAQLKELRDKTRIATGRRAAQAQPHRRRRRRLREKFQQLKLAAAWQSNYGAAMLTRPGSMLKRLKHSRGQLAPARISGDRPIRPRPTAGQLQRRAL